MSFNQNPIGDLKELHVLGKCASKYAQLINRI